MTKVWAALGSAVFRLFGVDDLRDGDHTLGGETGAVGDLDGGGARDKEATVGPTVGVNEFSVHAHVDLGTECTDGLTAAFTCRKVFGQRSWARRRLALCGQWRKGQQASVDSVADHQVTSDRP